LSAPEKTEEGQKILSFIGSKLGLNTLRANQLDNIDTFIKYQLNENHNSETLDVFIKCSHLFSEEKTHIILFQNVFSQDDRFESQVELVKSQGNLLRYIMQPGRNTNSPTTIKTVLNNIIGSSKHDRVIYTIKEYFMRQYPNALFLNQKLYLKYFIANLELKRFILWRYFDLYFISICYAIFIAWHAFSTWLFLKHQYPTLTNANGIAVLSIKLFGLFTYAGSLWAWIRQIFKPVDVYMSILGNLSKELPLSRLINELSSSEKKGWLQRRAKSFISMWDKDKGIGVVLIDWLQNDPSLTFCFCMLTTLLWQGAILSLPWIFFLILPTLFILIVVPKTDYIFTATCIAENGYSKKRRLPTAIPMALVLIALLSTLSLPGLVSLPYAWVSALIFIVIILSVFIFLAYNARKAAYDYNKKDTQKN
jgi:hypothetical protein